MLQAVQSKDPARIQGAWQAVSPYLSQLTGKQAPPAWSDDMLPALYQTLATTGGMPDQKGTVVAPGGVLVDSVTGKQMFANPAAQQYHDVPMGEGKAAGVFDPSTGTIRPATVAGAPSSGNPMQSYIDQANQAVKLGADPDKVQAWLQQQAQGAGLQPQPPGQAAQPSPQFGVGTPKAPADSALERKIQIARSMGATDEQIKQMVLGPSATTEANATLSDGDERMAQALAHYQLPAGARFISTKANRAIVQRALEINPELSTANYDQSHKFLLDLSSSSPTSAGGVITAAKTALNHLSDLADLSDKLPSHWGFVNAGENALSSTFNRDTADTLKEWNTAKGKVAAEVLKMVKGGQINESESKEMINDLDPNSPNRNAAIAQLARLMTDKAAAMEDKRDAILGSLSPHTSYLSAQDQEKARHLIGLSKNLQIPDFAPPGGYGAAVPGASSGAQKTAPASQGADFSHLWN
jgi:hypothetical protein